MSSITQRPWLKYLIGAIAVVVFLVLVWLDTRSKWIADRDQTRAWILTHAGTIIDGTSVPPAPRAAPWSLRICGESGVASITIDELKMRQHLPSTEDRDPRLAARRVQRLFPEADVRIRNLQRNEEPFLEESPSRD